MGGCKEAYFGGKNTYGSRDNSPVRTQEEQDQYTKIQQEHRERERKERNYAYFNLWNSGIEGKLQCYSKPKLCKLAKNKKFKGYSKLSKDELVNLLKKVAVNTDFPIKD